MKQTAYKEMLVLSVIIVSLALFVSSVSAIDLRDWGNQVTNINKRFKVLPEFNNVAVLDKETQLVWELAPSLTSETWSAARITCINKTVGNRVGWRLPSFYELGSLIDPLQSEPALPIGHPFQNIQSLGTGHTDYWAAQKDSENDSLAYFVRMENGAVNRDPKTGSNFVWCVRGAGAGPSVY